MYFSGHGTSWYDKNNKQLRQGDLTPNTGALLPADLDLGQKTVKAIMAQLIIGTRDLRPRFEKLDQGRQVLAVFDACYSGESVRSIRARSVGTLALRGIPRSQNVFDNMEDLTQLGDYTPEVHDDNPYPYQNVVYISASSMREEALDLDPGMHDTLDGRPHGALTDALLLGLSGEANTNGDKQITTPRIVRLCQAVGFHPVIDTRRSCAIQKPLRWINQYWARHPIRVFPSLCRPINRFGWGCKAMPLGCAIRLLHWMVS